MPGKPPIFNPRGTAAERGNAYERERGSARERGYSSSWDKASKSYLARHPVCLGCQAIGATELACVTDHILPHNGAQALFWNEANWQPSCRWHHDVIKQQLEALFAKGQAKAIDLRLDSPLAKRMASAERRGG